MQATLTHTLHNAIELSYQDQLLFKYIYEPDTPAMESPRPYFHPLRTLDGNEVSLYRPYDHLWHIGLSMCIANLSPANLPQENFWGGATYVRERGYVQLDNNGHIQHTGWQEMTCDDKIRCVERLQWVTHMGAIWLDEERQIVVSEINPSRGYWSLDLSFRLLNVAQQPLVFGSPTTEGRPDAGYGSLFWRGPRSFLHGSILGAGDLEGPSMMGKRSPWLAFCGKHDGNATSSTLIFIDQPSNPRYPNKWFVRNDPYACVSYSFMFDEYYTVQPDEALTLTYRVVFANGTWSRTQIEEYVVAQGKRAFDM